MQSFDDVSTILRAAAQPLGAVTVPLAAAAGHVLAGDVTARLDAPRTAVSVMDGYAVRAVDLPGPFRLVGTAPAGTAEALSLSPGEAVRIFTGAPLPAGADRVLVQEIVSAEDGEARLVGQLGDDPFIRAQGSDFAAGAVLLHAGEAIDHRNIVLLAASDRAAVRVWRRPRVAIIATGDELAEPGTALETPGALPESVSLGVAALGSSWGAAVIERRILRDDPALITATGAELAALCDVLVIIGGASVGDRDFARHVVPQGGYSPLFEKSAIRPGRPIWAAKGGPGQYVLGLPGNPTSALVTARLFLAPLLHALGGGDYAAALDWVEVSLARPLAPAGGREHFARGVIEGGRATPFDDQRSSAQATLARASVLIRQAAGSAAQPAGSSLPCLRL